MSHLTRLVVFLLADDTIFCSLPSQTQHAPTYRSKFTNLDMLEVLLSLFLSLKLCHVPPHASGHFLLPIWRQVSRRADLFTDHQSPSQQAL